MKIEWGVTPLRVETITSENGFTLRILKENYEADHLHLNSFVPDMLLYIPSLC